MTNIQVLTRKFLSLRDVHWIHDEQGKLLFEASRPKVFGKLIELKNSTGAVIASINPQVWKSHPTWQISTKQGDYAIKRNKKSFERLYYIEGGLFDGTFIEGINHDTHFRIRHDEQVLAQASEEAFSVKAKHVVEVTDTRDEAQILAALVSVIISKEKQQARNNQNNNR